MNQKANVVFDFQAKTLKIEGELQPETPLLHDGLVDLLFSDHEYDFLTSKNESGVVRYSLFVSPAKKSAKPAKLKPPAPVLPSAADLDAVAAEAGDVTTIQVSKE